MTTPSLDDWEMPTVTSYTRSRTGAGVINLTGSGSVWLPLPVGVNAIQVTGYGNAKINITVTSDTNFSATVAKREVECSPSGASTVLSGVGRNPDETRFLYLASTSTVDASVVITTFPL